MATRLAQPAGPAPRVSTPGPSSLQTRPPSRWRGLVNAVTAVRSTDPATVESALTDLGGRRGWLAPLAYAAGTVAVVFDGVLLLIRNWRLSLLQLLPAVWIWAMTWNLKNHVFANADISVGLSILAAVVVLVAAQAAYWCNATFAYTIAQDGETDFGAAFRAARPHWRFISGLALLTGGLQAGIWLLVPHVEPRWLSLALLVMFVVQIYLFIAIPTWLLGVRKSGTRRERTMQSLTTGVLSGVAVTPGFLLERIGLLLLGTSLWIVGVVIVSIGAVFHVTASSSVRVVKMSLKLRPEGQGSAPGEGAPGGRADQAAA
jgi:hypothetical protein